MIGTTYGDSELSICFEGEDRGKVFYSKLFSAQDFRLVANSFSEFINGFEPETDDDDEEE